MVSKAKKTQADVEWENRILCSDESCIGVIGSDGRCKECGIPYDGDLKEMPVSADTTDSSDTTDSPDADVSDDEKSIPQGADEWENRKLCSDGSCIGIIGPDGRCKECGKPFSKVMNE
jgi:hypothetical protein